jgi:hypothetical protein
MDLEDGDYKDDCILGCWAVYTVNMLSNIRYALFLMYISDGYQIQRLYTK